MSLQEPIGKSYSLLDFPNEILLKIIYNIRHNYEWYLLAQTCKHFSYLTTLVDPPDKIRVSIKDYSISWNGKFTKGHCNYNIESDCDLSRIFSSARVHIKNTELYDEFGGDIKIDDKWQWHEKTLESIVTAVRYPSSDLALRRGYIHKDTDTLHTPYILMIPIHIAIDSDVLSSPCVLTISSHLHTNIFLELSLIEFNWSVDEKSSRLKWLGVYEKSF